MFERLFEPVRVGPKTLPNRFYQVPHASGFGSDRPRTQAAFRAVKAEGGWGGVCTDYAPVSADSDETVFASSPSSPSTWRASVSRSVMRRSTIERRFSSSAI